MEVAYLWLLRKQTGRIHMGPESARVWPELWSESLNIRVNHEGPPQLAAPKQVIIRSNYKQIKNTNYDNAHWNYNTTHEHFIHTQQTQ